MRDGEGASGVVAHGAGTAGGHAEERAGKAGGAGGAALPVA
jgi:hypothetical protein